MSKYLLHFFSLFLLISSFGCVSSKAQTPQNEWINLFNGKDLKDWIVKIHHHEVGENHGNTFRVEEGIIKVRYDQYDTFNNRYGHLYYKTPYSHYHLKLEYRFTGIWRKDAPDYTIKNSGVMFHAQDPRSMLKEQDWPISVEMQFLAGLGDGKPRPTGSSPGTDIVYDGKIDPRHCIDSKSKTYEGDQWVKAELIVLGDSIVKHIINGDTVMMYTKPQIGGGVATGYNPVLKIDGKPLIDGYIALQSEGQEIDFRHIQMLNLENKKEPKSYPIFNGENLNGWTLADTNRWWTAQNGILSVKSTPDRKGSILWSVEKYENFVFETEFLMGDGVVDSGIFLRSENDQIQIGISGSLKRDMTGSPYIPKLRYPYEANVSGILKPKDWNNLKIRVEGKTYRVWLNGERVMTYTSQTMPLSGPIGFQLHPNNEMSIQYRNIKLGKI